jgi:CheY-like chemotaxis protein
VSSHLFDYLFKYPLTTLAERTWQCKDNELNRKLLEVRLEIYGYEALTTSKGAAALHIAREQQPDLILMDIQLPIFRG